MTAEKLMSKDFVKVDVDDTVSILLGRLRKSKKHNAVVLRNKRFAGVVNRRKMLQSKIRVDEEKVRRLLKRISVLKPKDDDLTIARKMAFSDVHMLPVVDAEKIPVGVVYAMDVAKLLPELQLHRKLGGFVKQRIVAFREDDSVGKAINTMRLKKVQHAPVVDKTGKLTGVLAAIDVLEKYNRFPRKRPGGKQSRKTPKNALEKEKTLVKLPISNFANTSVVSAHKNETVRKALKLMRKNNISDVIIVNDFDEPVGIITMKDIIDLVAIYL